MTADVGAISVQQVVDLCAIFNMDISAERVTAMAVPTGGSKAVTLEVIYFAMVPSVFALTRSGFRGLTARGITFSGSSLSAIYAGLSLEAASSAAFQPRTLPYLRAAMLYALHLMTAPTERDNDVIASHTFRQLNDALQFISFKPHD